MGRSWLIFLVVAFVFVLGSATKNGLTEEEERQVHPLVSLTEEEKDLLKRDYDYYCCSYYVGTCYQICRRYHLTTGATVGIIISSLLVVLGLLILCCFCGGWCCFKGRRQRSAAGQVYAAQVVPPNQPQPPPGYFYGSQPTSGGVTVVHHPPFNVYPQARAQPQPGMYYNNGVQVSGARKPAGTRY